MIASAASWAALPPKSRCAAARSSPRCTRSIGQRHADHAGRGDDDLRRRDSSSAAACRAVARASRSPRSPVHAFAQPELQTSARIVADSAEMLAR